MNGNLHRIRREAGFPTAREFAQAFGLDEGSYSGLEAATDGMATGGLAAGRVDLGTVNDLAALFRLPTAAVIGAEAMSDLAIRDAADAARSVLRFIDRAPRPGRPASPQVSPSIDAKGNVVLEAYGNGDAVIFRGGGFRPFVVAHGYDAETGEWSQGEYHESAWSAFNSADPEVIDRWGVTWTRQDIRDVLEDAGLNLDDPSKDAEIEAAVDMVIGIVDDVSYDHYGAWADIREAARAVASDAGPGASLAPDAADPGVAARESPEETR